MKPGDKEKIIKRSLTEVGRYLASGFKFLGIKEQVNSKEVIDYKGETFEVEVTVKKIK